MSAADYQERGVTYYKIAGNEHNEACNERQRDEPNKYVFLSFESINKNGKNTKYCVFIRRKGETKPAAKYFWSLNNLKTKKSTSTIKSDVCPIEKLSITGGNKKIIPKRYGACSPLLTNNLDIIASRIVNNKRLNRANIL